VAEVGAHPDVPDDPGLQALSRMPSEDVEHLLAEQVEYYRARAPEYDGSTSPEGDSLAPQGRRLAEALKEFGPNGRVLEIACGTGQWTRQLLEFDVQVTALDSSPEMIAINKEKIADDSRVRFVNTDVFSWELEKGFDVVLFGNWLSHIPPQRFESFWDLVGDASAPNGRVFFMDEAKDAWRHEVTLNETFESHPSVPLVRRSLADGRSYRVVKIFWDPQELKARLRGMGWDVSVHSTGAFYWGQGSRFS
jgi:SAM-dependent methyltransferase